LTNSAMRLPAAAITADRKGLSATLMFMSIFSDIGRFMPLTP
jgi:hypothetical protein